MNPPYKTNPDDTFLRVLDPKDNTAGGGSASALAGAMAAGLAAMVARVSIGSKASEPETFYNHAISTGTALAESLISGAGDDSLAFIAVMEAYHLPKRSESEIAERRAAIQAAMIRAALVPLENAERCAKVYSLTTELTGRSNPQAASDLQCAAYLAYAGIHGCLANVAINLPSVKDPLRVAEIEAKAAELRQSHPQTESPQ